MSDLVRQCPICGHLNPIDAVFCEKSGDDIGLVEPIPRPSPLPDLEEKPAHSSGEPVPAAPSKEDKQCPECGAVNPSVLALCQHCGFEFAGAAGEPENGLWLLVGNKTHRCRSGDILGRHGTVASEVFGGIQTISRHHVFISQDAGTWGITVPAAVENSTQLDGREIPRGVRMVLQGEHSLRLSSQCEVKLKVD